MAALRAAGNLRLAWRIMRIRSPKPARIEGVSSVEPSSQIDDFIVGEGLIEDTLERAADGRGAIVDRNYYRDARLLHLCPARHPAFAQASPSPWREGTRLGRKVFKYFR